MSVASLGGGSAEKYYYEKDSIFNEDGKGENLNWGGNIASNFGLFSSESVKQEDFKNALNGKAGDTDLRDHSKQTSGDERKAFDLPLSAPKSVSHAALVLGKKDVIEAHNEAVKKTMEYVETLAQAREYNDEGKRVKVNTNSLLYVSAIHSTSRATEGNVPDPSLHTHNVIMNTTRTEDGRYVSLNTDQIYKNQSTINEVYKNELANQLKEKGYGLQHDEKGNFQIAGYDKETIDNFSKRRNEIAEQAEQMKNDPKFAGKTDKELRNFAQHNLKQGKELVSKEDLKKDWDRQHRENGIMPKEELNQRIEQAKEDSKDQGKLTVNEILKIAGQNLVDKESHFSKTDLLKQALRINQGNNKAEDIVKAINDIKKIGQKEDSDLKKITVNGEEKITTRGIYNTEKENVKLISGGKEGESLLNNEQAKNGIANFEEKMGWKMTKTQRESAMMALTTSNQFSAIQGDAGTGKTTMLDAVRHAMEFNDKSSSDLLVLAPTGKAASGAMVESGIKGQTIDSYLMEQNKSTKLDYGRDPRTIFVDESSMVSAEKLNRLLNNADKHGDQVIFIGDTKQLQSVQQGKGFNEIQESTKTMTHMNEGMRQKTQETKDVVNAFAQGKPREGLEKLDQQGKLKEMSKEEQIKYISESLVKDGAYKNTVALATTKEDVKAINDKTRELLFGSKDAGVTTSVREDKRLDLVDKMNASNFEKGDIVSIKIKTESGKERLGNYEVKEINKEKNELLIGSDKKNMNVDLKKDFGNITLVEKVVQKSFIEGDKVINLKNDKKSGIMNGDTGYVKSIDEKQETMKVEFENGKTVDFNLKNQDKTLDHAYGMSVHKSQGITSDRVIAMFDTEKTGFMNNSNTAYVAVSRAKEHLEVLTDNKEKLKDQVGKAQVKASTNDSSEGKADLNKIKEEIKKYEEVNNSEANRFKTNGVDIDSKQIQEKDKFTEVDSKNISKTEDKKNNKEEFEKFDIKENKPEDLTKDSKVVEVKDSSKPEDSIKDSIKDPKVEAKDPKVEDKDKVEAKDSKTEDKEKAQDKVEVNDSSKPEASKEDSKAEEDKRGIDAINTSKTADQKDDNQISLNDKREENGTNFSKDPSKQDDSQKQNNQGVSR